MLRSSQKKLRTGEFVPLIAILMSLVALSVDAMLPALPEIGRDLGAQHRNEAQYVITALFVGLSFGQLLFGPLSDRIGRKPAIIIGLLIFMVGCVVSIFASSFETMITGRILQGVGAASPRIVTMALVRDQFSGQQMARIMSFAMAIFILVPAIAPLLGQTILLMGDWRLIFATFLTLAVIVFVWFFFRQPETLAVENRLSVAPRAVIRSVGVVLRTRQALGYALATGFIFAPFVAYLSTAQQVFQEAYDTGKLFPAYFGALALAIGLGALVNDRLLRAWGMHQISKFSTLSVSVLSFAAFAGFVTFDSLPPLWLFTGYLGVLFFLMGTIFGNLNALTMEPLGYVAGIGAALTSAMAVLVSVTLGGIVGQFFDGTVNFLACAFALFGIATLTAMWWGTRPDSEHREK